MVNQSILEDKLACVGVKGHALNWFDNYLSNRTQSVYFNGTLSDPMHLSLGVPQGS